MCGVGFQTPGVGTCVEWVSKPQEWVHVWSGLPNPRSGYMCGVGFQTPGVGTCVEWVSKPQRRAFPPMATWGHSTHVSLGE